MIDPRVYTRQTGLVNPELLTLPITIVGNGSIGSWTALGLLKLGCSDITICDDDAIEVHNAGSQVYTSFDAGKLKTDALVEKLPFLVESPESLHIISRKTTAEDIHPECKIVIMAVDSITVREQFFRRLKNSDRWFVDGRMGGNIVEVYTTKLDDEAACAAYEKTLFPESEASPIPCSARSVVYNCFTIAGTIVNIVGRIVNGKTTPAEITLDLENFQMYI